MGFKRSAHKESKPIEQKITHYLGQRPHYERLKERLWNKADPVALVRRAGPKKPQVLHVSRKICSKKKKGKTAAAQGKIAGARAS